jgi:hypothetical protein
MNGISVFLFALLYYYHCDGDDDGRWTMDDGRWTHLYYCRELGFIKKL